MTTAPMRQEAKAAGVCKQEILDGAKMNLPLMEEVTKRAQKAKSDAQIGFIFDSNK
jgi:hypothetical protein